MTPQGGPAQTRLAGAGREAAMPVAAGGIAGLFQPADAGVPPRKAAILMLPPWGFEDMCTRKFYRLIAEHLAGMGMASLRIDYPGTGDSAGGPEDDWTFADWENAAIASAATLRALTGRQDIIVIGQGIGATIAQTAGAGIGDVSGIVLLAPVQSGRTYLRELSMWSRVVDQGLGLRDDQRDLEGVSIAGLRMPQAVADAIRKINITAPTSIIAPHYLLLERAARLGDTTFADALTSHGAAVTTKVFDGYDELVLNPTFQTIPVQTIQRIGEWVADINPVSAEQGAAVTPPSAEIRGEGYRETLVRFGAGNNLYGIFCVPDIVQPGKAVLILTTSYDRASGWGRSGVDTARKLASEGIASFRFDSANVGDSPPHADSPPQVLYSELQTRDAMAAVDLMQAELGGDVMVVGRCSGAYLAIRHALADSRVSGLVTINPFTFFWEPGKPVDGVLRFVPRSLEDYGNRLARLDTLKRLFSGDIDIRSASRNIALVITRRLGRFATPLLNQLPGRRPLHQETRRTFKSFAARDMPVGLIYSEGDVGLEDLNRHYGAGGKGLGRYGNVRLTMLADTDHNLTPPHSRELAFHEILRVARA
jgi:alpha-beta hydrolase superfamily lysophospholipase